MNKQQYINDQQPAASCNEDVILRPKLYALIIGINNYEGMVHAETIPAFMSLRGCVNDALKIKAYLENLKGFDIHIKILLNEEATRQSIITGMREHLSQAGSDDVAFMYFSGHGTQEQAGPGWDRLNNGILESLVCAPGNDIYGEFLLCNKELRFLVKNLASKQPHIVTIFDCCHSGENTRSYTSEQPTEPIVIEKKLATVFPQRKWNQFIFCNEFSESDLLQEGEEVLLPEGLHIQISACESDQTAVEVAGEGVFTKALLNVLEATKGNITYYALRSRVRQYLRTIYRQTPKIYIAGGGEAGLYNNFLNSSESSTTRFAEVVYNERSGWLLNRGAIHGIQTKHKTIQILNPTGSEKTCVAAVDSIKTDYTELIPEITLDETKIYLAYLEDLVLRKIRVSAKDLNQYYDEVGSSFHHGNPAYMASSTNGNPGNILFLNSEHIIAVGSRWDKLMSVIKQVTEVVDFTDDPGKADYTLSIWKGIIYITRPNEPFQPLCNPINMNDASCERLISTQLRHIAKWEFIKNLLNDVDDSNLPTEVLDIQVYQQREGLDVLCENENDQFDIAFSHLENNGQSKFRITITNKSGIPVYCCMPYLSSWFGSDPDQVQPIVYKLEPGIPLDLPQQRVADSLPQQPIGRNLKQHIKYYNKSLPDVAYYYNWQDFEEYLKIIWSTDEFDGSAFILEDLPQPVTPRSGGNSRSVSGVPPSEIKIKRGWSTRLLRFRFLNPLFNAIYSEDLAALLKNPATIEFARQLYFDISKCSDDNNTYVLKSDITLLQESHWKIGISETSLVALANRKGNLQPNHAFIN
jgi:hypothetical protein